jgi:hypothetical protein
VETADLIALQWGVLQSWPLESLDIRYDLVKYSSEEEYLMNEVIKRDEYFEQNSKMLSEIFALKAFITINQIVSVSLEEWLGASEWRRIHGLEESMKRALLYEVEFVLQERERHQRDREQKAKLDQAQTNAQISLPHNLGGIQNYLR